MSRSQQEGYHTLRGDVGSGSGSGNGGRHERRGAREWGGRVGARLDQLDSAARSAMREAARAAQRRRLATLFIAPAFAVVLAFSIGLFVGRRTGE